MSADEHGLDLCSSALSVAKILARDGEGVVAEGLVEFYFLDAVLREECALWHFKALRETERNQHAVYFLELAVRGAKRVPTIIEKKLHHSSSRGIDVEISRVVFRIGYAEAA